MNQGFFFKNLSIALHSNHSVSRQNTLRKELKEKRQDKTKDKKYIDEIKKNWNEKKEIEKNCKNNKKV